MERADASDLLAFLAVARERSFTRAAARLAISQPTLSQTVQNLEERLGVRLLNRTTRSVTPTQAGERLLLTIGPKFDEMDVELGALSELREKPAGTIRITATEYAAQAILMPAMAKIAPAVSGHQSRGDDRRRPHEHRGGAVRRRDPAGRTGG